MRTLILIFAGALAAFGQSSEPVTTPGPPRVAGPDFSSLNFADHFIVGEVKGVISPAKAVVLRKPEFPDNARRLGLEGTVRVDIVIGVDGAVTSAEIVSGEAPFRDAALFAARNSLFRAGGNEVRGYLLYEFRIKPLNWFAVAFDLHAFQTAQPVLILKTIPEEWSTERSLANQMMTPSANVRPVTRSDFRRGDGKSASISGVFSINNPVADRAAVTELIEKLRLRLGGSDLRMFRLGEAMAQAIIVSRNLDLNESTIGLIRPFADDPTDLPPEWATALREFVSNADYMTVPEFRAGLQALAMKFNSTIGSEQPEEQE